MSLLSKVSHLMRTTQTSKPSELKVLWGLEWWQTLAWLCFTLRVTHSTVLWSHTTEQVTWKCSLLLSDNSQSKSKTPWKTNAQTVFPWKVGRVVKEENRGTPVEKRPPHHHQQCSWLYFKKIPWRPEAKRGNECDTCVLVSKRLRQEAREASCSTVSV